jgi:hypothetical protein
MPACNTEYCPVLTPSIKTGSNIEVLYSQTISLRLPDGAYPGGAKWFAGGLLPLSVPVPWCYTEREEAEHVYKYNKHNALASGLVVINIKYKFA